jgi:hypothetical protein
MDNKVLRRWPLMLAVGGILLALLATSGCSNRVSGTMKNNEKPVAYFVNIPPDGSFSSRNPIVYWAGTDPDGRVIDFRYIVVPVASMGAMTPQQYAATLADLPKTDWLARGGIYLHVSDSLPNTQTSATVKMSADLNDPVNSYVSQYVFLQASDDRGTLSNVAMRLLKRNDNPPSTKLQFLNYDENTSPFINSVISGGAISGVRFKLEGEDLLDYPVDAPPFEFEWKLFGPYTYVDSAHQLEYGQVLAMILDTVFVTTDAHLYHFGEGEYQVFYCDSLDTVNDTVYRIPCDTLFIDTITRDNQYGHIRTILDVNDSTFRASSLGNSHRLVDSSNGWTTAQYDTVFNLYRDPLFQSDSTIQRRFILWARSRDDAAVMDLTPAFGPCAVIEPRYERDVYVVNFVQASSPSTFNCPIFGGGDNYWPGDTAYHYWKDFLTGNNARGIAGWRPEMVFDTSDYYSLTKNNNRIPLKAFLQHKVAILFSDDAVSSVFYDATGASTDASIKTLKAVDAGVNVWMVMRAPLGGAKADGARFYRPASNDQQFGLYFGVDSVRYTGWLGFAGASQPINWTGQSIRIEDFIGAYSLQPGWPMAVVDTNQYHRRYKWSPSVGNRLRWMDTLGAVAEVGWVFRKNYTQPLYLYKSKYGSIHPLGTQYSYEGTPVAHRTNGGTFRTAFFGFSPLYIADSTGQVIVDSVMNFLYDKYLTAPPTGTRYPNADIQLSPADIARMDAIRTKEYLEKHNKTANPSFGD